jgi:hypothetical protein
MNGSPMNGSPISRFCFVALLLCLLSWLMPAFGQSSAGELRIKVTDPSGLAVRCWVELVSEANQYRNTLVTDDQGNLDVQRLPYGVYQLGIKQPGFANVSESVEIRSSIPAEHAIQLQLPAVSSSVTVKAGDTLINPDHKQAPSAKSAPTRFKAVLVLCRDVPSRTW